MLKKYLLAATLLLALAPVSAQWVLTMNIIDNCSYTIDIRPALEIAHMESLYKGETFNDRASCEAAQNVVYSTLRQYSCLSVTCHCSGHDAGGDNTVSRDPNMSPSFLSTEQGRAYSPNNAESSVRTWIEDEMKKWNGSLPDNNLYYSTPSTYDSYEDYFSSVYEEIVDYGDRNRRAQRELQHKEKEGKHYHKFDRDAFQRKQLSDATAQTRGRIINGPHGFMEDSKDFVKDASEGVVQALLTQVDGVAGVAVLAGNTMYDAHSFKREVLDQVGDLNYLMSSKDIIEWNKRFDELVLKWLENTVSKLPGGCVLRQFVRYKDIIYTDYDSRPKKND